MSTKRDGLVDPRVAKALAHPVRAHVLAILNDRVASPNQMAEELGEPLGNVSYHVKALLELECIELVSTTPRRGAVEHFYRAIMRPYFSDQDWRRLPPSMRQAISDVGLQLIWDDVTDAIERGSFEARDDRHLTRSPLVLDEQGWDAVTALLGELFDKTVKIEADSAARLAKSGESGISTKLAVLHFESPAPEGSSETPARGKAKSAVTD
ncbi:MAG TPA: helix-turn-helix domain-containing protein [Thermoleophilaceae bacterium]|nr:helix-turn-helix domain-containing protein [Thermoleophilaceae bacterium]